jgi:hypothetical protein
MQCVSTKTINSRPYLNCTTSMKVGPYLESMNAFK